MRLFGGGRSKENLTKLDKPEDETGTKFDAVSLISALSPLTKVSAREEHNLYQGAAIKRTERMQGQQANPLDLTAVAPYQAMPVHGPLITHNQASGLEVTSENSDGITPEVRPPNEIRIA